MRKIVSIIVLLLVAAGALFFYFRFYFVFGEGVKSGELNYVVRKGFVFKTYEGKLIQAGFRTQSAGIQSYEFEFSVADKAVAERLMLLGGQSVELHYKEYFGALPWRGFTKFVVDSIVSYRPIYPQYSPGTLPFKGQEPSVTTPDNVEI
jgi:hypothetical protein